MLSTLGLLASLAVGTFDLPNRATRRGRKTRGQLGQGNVSQSRVDFSELYPAPRLSFSIALRLNSLLSWQLEGGQRSYTQF